MAELSALYENQYDDWARRTAELLAKGRWSELDIPHLIEELDGMGRSERNELESRLAVLLTHLLKWQFQYRLLSERWQEFRGDSWRSTLIEQRARIIKRLDKTPGLKAALDPLITEAYGDARDVAMEETGLPLDRFPRDCPYTQAQILDLHFYPRPE